MRRLPDGGAGRSHRPRHAGLRLRSAEGVGPVERWSDERFLWHYFPRWANEEDLPGLMADLEWSRERVTVQETLAERDYERCDVVPGMSTREGKAGG